jgi:hypothetical protein
MLPFGIFGTLFQAVFTSGLTINDIENVIKDGMTLAELLATGKYGDALSALRGDLVDELPLFEKVAGIVFPGVPIARALEVLAQLVSGSHKMTPDAEQTAIATVQVP